MLDEQCTTPLNQQQLFVLKERISTYYPHCQYKNEYIFSNPLGRDILSLLYIQTITADPITKGNHEDL